MFISSSTATKKGLITVLEATTGVIKNLRTDEIYISSTHDKRKGIYIVKTLGKSHSPSSPAPTNTGQLMKISKELLTLHVRLGHQGIAVICRAMTTKALKNLPDQKISEAICKCEVCCQAKSKKKEKGKKSEVPEKVLHRICVNDSGPHSRTPNGKTMFQVRKDLTSKFLSVALHNNKATSPEKLKEWIDYMEHQTEMTVKEIRTDNAGEYTSAKFKAWCKEKRINHQTSAPYKQNQNGVAENAVHQLKTMA